jgi:hypothetical protein
MRLFLALIIVLTVSAPSTGSDLCPRALRIIFSKIITKHYDDPKIYQCDWCFYNAGELGRIVSKKLKQKIDPKSLRILLVRHKKIGSIAVENAELPQMIVGSNTRKDVAFWKYHAVLEYGGQVLDLDLGGGGEALPFHKWVDTMFKPMMLPKVKFNNRKPPKDISFNRRQDLIITAIPIDEYFKRFEKRPEDQDEGLNKLDEFFSFPKIDIDKFYSESQRRKDRN